MSESMPHLKLGAINDFLNILKADNEYDERRHNKTEQSYQLRKGVIEFFSAEDSGKVHGPRRDILYINECNNVDYEVFYQASMRTNLCTFLDFNPVQSFWVHDKLMPMCMADEYAFIRSTYRDNNYLSEKIVRDIERRAAVDDNYRRVYAEGEIGSLEGLIYKQFNLVDTLPETNRRAVVFEFCNSRQGHHASTLLEGFEGSLVCDDYSGYKGLFKKPHIKEAGCWAHARRKFFEAHKLNQSEIAKEALHRIQQLYELERQGALLDQQERLQLRKTQSAALLKEFKAWLLSQRQQLMNADVTAKAMDYTLSPPIPTSYFGGQRSNENPAFITRPFPAGGPSPHFVRRLTGGLHALQGGL